MREGDGKQTRCGMRVRLSYDFACNLVELCSDESWGLFFLLEPDEVGDFASSISLDSCYNRVRVGSVEGRR